MLHTIALAALYAAGLGQLPEAADPAPFVDPRSLGVDGYADSGGVKIHYVTQGEGPLLVLIHGFPDCWYSWRGQIPTLAKSFQVVAVDQRGYNLSGQPEGVESYAMGKLVGDVEAVLRHFNREKAVVVGHDWGGAVAWSFAMAHPEMTDRLVILNLPHPRGLARELAENPVQRANSAYAYALQKPLAAKLMTPEVLAMHVKDPAARAVYVEAFRRSSIPGMLSYYKANYPQPGTPAPPMPQVKCPVLMIHGLGDKFLLPGALNDTWKWVDGELTLVTIPRVGHFVQHEAAARVNEVMTGWLAR